MLFVKVADSEDGGVILTKRWDDGKTSTVFLSASAWNQLSRHQGGAQAALENGSVGSWVLQKNTDGSQLMLSVSDYNNHKVVHIRMHVDGVPTRQGVTMNAASFAYLRTFLANSAEFSLGRTEYKWLLMDEVWKKHGRDCEGCRMQYGGQRDHMCLRPPSNASELITGTGVDPFIFQAELVAKCSERKIHAYRPHAVYKMLHLNYRDEVEREVVAELDAKYREEHI